jgi:hypothetical protein
MSARRKTQAINQRVRKLNERAMSPKVVSARVFLFTPNQLLKENKCWGEVLSMRANQLSIASARRFAPI